MQALTFFFAFVAVLALIGVAAWLVRRFAGNRLGTNANRGRMPRLAVIDAAAVDGRRRLVLVRRDNVEHLLMIGGPTDIVVEPNIVRAIPGRDQAQRPVAGELPRIPPLADSGNWADSDGGIDHAEPHLPEPPPRPARPAFADEMRRPAPAIAERRPDRDSIGRAEPPLGRAERAEPLGRGDPMAGFVPEPMQRPEPRIEAPPPRPARSEPPMMPRNPARLAEPSARTPPPMRSAERAPAPQPIPPVPVPPPAAPAAPISSADQNLADMAQRLEAALRRPAGDAAEPRVGAPPVAPEPPPSRPPPRSEAPVVAAPRQEPQAPPSQKSGFENLEDEMASLLGRPKTPS